MLHLSEFQRLNFADSTSGANQTSLDEMRVIKTYDDPALGISIFSFNEKWIVKFAAGRGEIIYKFGQEEYELSDVERICMSDEFRMKVFHRIGAMHDDYDHPPFTAE